jgi:hypothetical protein
MFEISKKELLVKTNNLLHMDARFAISKLFRENKKFDLILIDCY